MKHLPTAYYSFYFFSLYWTGKCRLRMVSVSLNKDAKVILTTRKVSLLIGLSSAQESETKIPYFVFLFVILLSP